MQYVLNIILYYACVRVLITYLRGDYKKGICSNTDEVGLGNRNLLYNS